MSEYSSYSDDGSYNSRNHRKPHNSSRIRRSRRRSRRGSIQKERAVDAIFDQVNKTRSVKAKRAKKRRKRQRKLDEMARSREYVPQVAIKRFDSKDTKKEKSRVNRRARQGADILAMQREDERARAAEADELRDQIDDARFDAILDNVQSLEAAHNDEIAQLKKNYHDAHEKKRLKDEIRYLRAVARGDIQVNDPNLDPGWRLRASRLDESRRISTDYTDLVGRSRYNLDLENRMEKLGLEIRNERLKLCNRTLQSQLNCRGYTQVYNQTYGQTYGQTHGRTHGRTHGQASGHVYSSSPVPWIGTIQYKGRDQCGRPVWVKVI